MIPISNNRYILVNHQPVLTLDIEAWAKFMNEEENFQVSIGKDGGVIVSTIFLGVTSQVDADGRPMLFETYITRGNHNGYQQRYATWDEAMFGHSFALKLTGLEPIGVEL